MKVSFKKKGKAAVAGGARAPAADRHWFYVHAGETKGPFGDSEMCREADEGRVLATDEVWRDDQPDKHVRGYEVADLFPNAEAPPVATPAQSVSVAPADAPQLPNLLFQSSAGDVGSITCPYCWYRGEPRNLLFIARHPLLVGDPILGRDEPRRFLPSRFTPDGHAIDAEGVVCPDVACPRCHMRLPRAVLSLPPLFVSIVGAPASGKSYFLTSMCWRLRRTLPRLFHVRFTDADGQVNRWLNGYEERLFVQADDTAYQSIDKTQLQGGLYREIMYNGMAISLPLPSVFVLQADESSAFHHEAGEFVNRSLVLYDNAGEHFEPGRDTAADPGTHHLIHSEAVFFSYDPTKDPGFRRALRGMTQDEQVSEQHPVQRQDVLLGEVINRIRLYQGRDARERYTRPLIVMLSKADVLGAPLASYLRDDPWRWDEAAQAGVLDVTRILQASFVARKWLEEFSPELVAAVEAFASDVIYVPVSALGHSPVPDPNYRGEGVAPLVVRPCDVHPRWVEVPLLYTLFRLGYIGGSRVADPAHPAPTDCQVRGGRFLFTLPGTQRRLTLPLTYAGVSLPCPETGRWFRVPEAPAG